MEAVAASDRITVTGLTPAQALRFSKYMAPDEAARFLLFQTSLTWVEQSGDGYRVRSRTHFEKGIWYRVYPVDGELRCECPATKRCRHIHMVLLSQTNPRLEQGVWHVTEYRKDGDAYRGYQRMVRLYRASDGHYFRQCNCTRACYCEPCEHVPLIEMLAGGMPGEGEICITDRIAELDRRYAHLLRCPSVAA